MTTLLGKSFHEFPGPTEMNFHDLLALHFSRNKRNITNECIPQLVVTVPAGCSSENCLHSLLTFIREFLSAVVKN